MIELLFKGTIGNDVYGPFQLGSKLSEMGFDYIDQYIGANDSNGNKIFWRDKLRSPAGETLRNGKYETDYTVGILNHFNPSIGYGLTILPEIDEFGNGHKEPFWLSDNNFLSECEIVKETE